jgi:transglutaminase-like putative cysteine protease
MSPGHSGGIALATRTFEITTRVELDAAGPARAWIPLPLARETAYQSDHGHTIDGNASHTRVEQVDGAPIVVAEWHGGPAPALLVTSRVTTLDHRVDLRTPAEPRRPSNLSHYLRPTALIPLDGIVHDTAIAVTKSQRTELGRARAIYDWIVENTVRNPEVKGCGLGDIRWMLETKNLSGKCADLNALFVGLARAAGLPARDLYGIRVAPSVQFPSLGRAGGNITTAQHCRAEVYVTEFGWVPVDPADVRKLILEERPQATLSDAYVARVRETLFGSWEMNWIAYNDAHDVALPGAAGKPLPFLMYPQAEAGGVRRDSLDPAGFRYTIAAREL